MKAVFIFCASLLLQSASAQLRLPSFIADNMVLQQHKVNNLWGWGVPQQLVTVTFNQQQYEALCDKEGRWQVYLQVGDPGSIGDVVISSGADRIVLHNILSGEVWICSGQSNMEMKMRQLDDTYHDELVSADNDSIRYVVINRSLAGTPQEEVTLEKKWTAITPGTIGDCSAVAYWYAKKIQKQLHVPVGLVITSWGGTPAEAWTSFEGLHDFPAYTNSFLQKARKYKLDNIDEQVQALKIKFESQLVNKAPFIHEAMLPGYDDGNWKKMYLPKPWEQQGFPTLDGVVLYRIYFDVPAADAGKTAILNMPAIDDMDSTYINGVFVGSINQYDAIRTYKVPAGLLKPGKNLLAIRVQDDQGGGGLSEVPEKFNINIDGKGIPLAGQAAYLVVAEKETITGGAGDIEDQPTLLFNAMISPLVPLTIKGAIWYQGETNADPGRDPLEYATLFPAMINDWRNRWGQGDFPFLFVQLSSYGPVQTKPAQSAWAALRESQAKTLRLPNTGMAVSIDVGNPADIHPHCKRQVGERLADNALKLVYKKKMLVSSGPQVRQFNFKGSEVIVQFDQMGSGLMMKGNKLKGFSIAGADKKFVWANAAIRGNQVFISAPGIRQPVAVRYAWADSPVEANLYNREGYPAIPFRTDDWKLE